METTSHKSNKELYYLARHVTIHKIASTDTGPEKQLVLPHPG